MHVPCSFSDRHTYDLVRSMARLPNIKPPDEWTDALLLRVSKTEAWSLITAEKRKPQPGHSLEESAAGPHPADNDGRPPARLKRQASDPSPQAIKLAMQLRASLRTLGCTNTEVTHHMKDHHFFAGAVTLNLK